ncbi:MAG: STAS domain-containing protein [Pseudomonadota bacterium]
MKVTQENTTSGSRLIFEGELTIYTVSLTQEKLLESHDEAIDPVAIDASNISEIDTAGVQLLLFAKKIFADNNKRFYLEKSNPQVDSVLNTLDVAAHFALSN